MTSMLFSLRIMTESPGVWSTGSPLGVQSLLRKRMSPFTTPLAAASSKVTAISAVARALWWELCSCRCANSGSRKMARVCAMMPAYGTMTARSFDPAARRISGFGRWATRMSTPSLGSFSVLRYTVKPGNCLLRIRASSCSPASMKRKMRRLMRRTNARRSCLGRWAPARHIRLTASGSTSPSASAPPSAKSVVSLFVALQKVSGR
mmetsp:Transcript_11384/g.42493  ORF Transcript_11384/g.42493 Transcript_11384/m.42493 type:complete len:206 (+) Transcript_11384:749-1366(+)